jgi:hypothetical protein
MRIDHIVGVDDPDDFGIGSGLRDREPERRGLKSLEVLNANELEARAATAANAPAFSAAGWSGLPPPIASKRTFSLTSKNPNAVTAKPVRIQARKVRSLAAWSVYLAIIESPRTTRMRRRADQGDHRK